MIRLGIVLLALLLAGCNTVTGYISSSQGKTQQEIEQELGPPVRVITAEPDLRVHRYFWGAGKRPIRVSGYNTTNYTLQFPQNADFTSFNYAGSTSVAPVAVSRGCWVDFTLEPENGEWVVTDGEWHFLDGRLVC